MSEVLKKAGIILGHIICFFVVIYCFANQNKFFPEEEKTIHTVMRPTNVITPTVTITSEPTNAPITEPVEVPTEEPIPTKRPEPTITETPMPTVTVTLTPTPTATVTPTLIPTVTPTPIPTPEHTSNPVSEREAVKKQVLKNITDGIYSDLDNSSDSWWFKRKNNHLPSGTGELFDISEYQGFFMNKNVPEGDKVIYLTIDCGYGSSNTAVLLDVFKQQGVKVTFFVTNYFLKANPKEVRRMVEEGHAVGNHSVSHLDLTALTEEEIYAEIIGCEEKFTEITGEQMNLFFRPPTGAYSKRTMQITEDLGYRSIFWSIAYNDYDKSNQPGKEYVINHFADYHHNGAVALMHNDSDSNMEAMSEVIEYLRDQGYRFGTLDELK